MILPDGRCDIILRYNTHGSGSPIPIITGPATQPYTVEYDVGDSWLGIRLRPGKGVMLWQQRIASAANTVLRGQDALELLPRLAGIKGHHSTLNILAAALEAKTTGHITDHRLSLALDILHASGGRIRIERLATYVGCTSRHLNRMFRSNMGLSAKTYAQLLQFHRTLKLIQHEHLSIADAAFEGGYADHAHLSRAFQCFGGFTPSRVPHDLSLPALFS